MPHNRMRHIMTDVRKDWDRRRSGPRKSWYSDTCLNTDEIMRQRRGYGIRQSVHFDRPDLCSTVIDRNHGQFARVLDRQAAEVIHDRLPFLDFQDRAALRAVATLSLSSVPSGGSRSGVSLRGSSSASTFDLRGCPSLFLATRASLPFVYLGMATTIMASIKGQVRLYKCSSFPLMSMAW